MKVYQLKNIPERFKTFQLDPLALCKQLGNNDLLPLLLGHSGSDTPLLPHWVDDVSSSFTAMSKHGDEIPDLSLWGSNRLILNIKAYDGLKRYLESEGEFLPIMADGEPMHVFNCLSFGKEDEKLCVKKYADGERIGLETLVFEDEDIAKRFLFKSELQFGGALYCSSSFKTLCNEMGLQGLRFDEDLLNPF